MNRLERIEAVRNFFDLGYFQQTLKNSVRTQIDMGIKSFLKYLLFGSGYTQLTPPQLEKRLKEDPSLLVVDLRSKSKFRNGHIKNALSYPFDDFVKMILMDEYDRMIQDKQPVLVCDTGHQSRVAASILSEAGIKNSVSLNRGMHRFNQWQSLKGAQKTGQSRCCNMNGLISK